MTRPADWHVRRGLLMTGICAMWPAAAALAQDVLQEIVVTAQKREQNLQDVGVSVTALAGDQLRQLGVTDATDIEKVAPSVLFTKTSSGGVIGTLSVRGVTQSDFSPNQESPNSVYIDEIYLSSPSEASFDLFDLERVEVLRGPQGTLFGRNSTGGLAHFITAKPTAELQGYTEAGYGRFNQFYVEAAASGPLSDRIRGRLSGRFERSDGWWDNRAPGGRDLFNKKSIGLRGQLEFDVTENLTARLTLSYDRKPRTRAGIYKHENFYVDASGQPAPLPADLDAYGTGPGNNFVGYRDNFGSGPVNEANNVGFFKSRRFAPTLRLEWSRESTTVTSLTNYTDFSFDYREDDDGSAIDFVQAYLGQTLKQWSQELRATHQAGASTWTVGAYYLDIKNQKLPQGFLFPLLAGTDFAFDDINVFSQTTRSYALFGQWEWQFAEKLRLTAGVRYTHDQKTFDSKVYFNELGNGYFGGTGSTVFDPPLLVYDFSRAAVGDLAKQKANLWAGKLQLDYRPHEGALLYAGISRGVKGGGFNTNIGANLTIAETPFKPEAVYAYEVGGKFDLLDRRLRLNSSAFYYDYRRFQGFAFNGLQGIVGNYDGAFYGAELELNASLPSRIQVRLGGSYNHSKLKDIPTAYSGVLDQEGLLAPHWIANGSVEKSIMVGSGELRLQWSFDYEGDRYGSVDNNPAVFVKRSFEHHARLDYELDNGLELAAYVHNIGNTHRQTFSYDFLSAVGSRALSLAPPRWWGVSIRKKF